MLDAPVRREMVDRNHHKYNTIARTRHPSRGDDVGGIGKAMIEILCDCRDMFLFEGEKQASTICR